MDGDLMIGEISYDNSVQRVYTWGANGPVSQKSIAAGTTRWFHLGPQGDTRFMTDGPAGSGPK